MKQNRKENKYFHYTGIKYTTDGKESKLLPCLTFCPVPAFKTMDLYYTEESFRNNSFSLEDMFDLDTATRLRNKTLFSISESQDFQIGICQTICVMSKMKVLQYLYFGLKKERNVRLYLHPKGSEFWILYTSFLQETQLITFDIKDNDSMASAELYISETKSTFLDRDHMPCKYYFIDEENHNENTEFYNCLKSQVLGNLKVKIACTVPGISTLIPANATISELHECPDRYSARYAITDIWYVFQGVIGNTSEYNCTLPCQHIGYNIKVMYYHRNSLYNKFSDPKVFILYVNYLTLMVEDRTETLNYDVANFLAAAGGNLGLMLGFSCLSLLYLGLQCFEKCLVYIFSNHMFRGKEYPSNYPK